MIDLAAELKLASLPTRTVQVCLKGDLLANLIVATEELEDALTRAADDLAVRMQLASTDEERAELADRDRLLKSIAGQQQALDVAQGAVRAAQLPFQLRAVPEWRLTEIATEHPPRDGVKDDQDRGVNGETYNMALLRESLVDPKPDDEQWEQLRRLLHYSQTEQLVDAAVSLSRRRVSLAPFSLGSAKTGSSAAS